MKPQLVAAGAILIASLLTVSCRKTLNGSLPNTTPVDSTVTDTTLFIDVQSGPQRIFQISSSTAATNSNWSWYPLIGFWGTRFPDTLHYQFSSLKGGLTMNDDTSVIKKGFYFLKNSYGLNLEAYTSSRHWVSPLILRSFIDSFFRPGNYSYAASTNKDTTYNAIGQSVTKMFLGTGVQLIWVDSTRKIWASSQGSADQANSFFTITKNTSVPFSFEAGYENYAETTTVTASFQCNLYDGTGNVLHLTNGRFRFLLRFKQDEY
jgi:hypothetical protein